MAKAKQILSREAQLEGALKNLVEACGYVQLLTGSMDATTVQDVRKIVKFLNAHDKARDLLGLDQ